MMRQIVFIFVFMLMATLPFDSFSQNKFAVVELFTSQGDINCPEADKLLSELNKQSADGVYCISLHVDFWNRFGWKDPFSSLKHTRRLTNYSSVAKDKETYTPYFVVNGVPTPSNQVKQEVNKQLGMQRQVSLNVNFQLFDDTLDVGYTLTGIEKMKKQPSAYYMNVVILEKPMDTKVTAGDNKGKTLRNENVSLLFHTTNIGASKGVARIPARRIGKSAGRRLLFFVQDKQTKKVVAAQMVTFE
ncbi:MAG: DUF1223 domain-containing protein [Bacteroidota bacterium]|jgi:hypothetical protein